MVAALELETSLAMQDELVFPMSKNAVVQHGEDASGAPALTLFYGDKEITFDDPSQFGFGEMLAKQTRFAAGEAIAWCDADWPRISKMLGELVEAGVLLRTTQETDGSLFKLAHEDIPSPLPPAPATEPHCWAEDGEALMQRLTGQPLEMGYLEAVVPIFRVAHMFLDGDGRQVGEANVFPQPLRLDIPTQWRTCTYSGTRYQPDKPMNITALKAMRVHWRQMMALLLKMREAYLNRFPKAREGWTVGDLERLSTAVLALPSYMVLRCNDPVVNGDLHPVLSNLFRVTDGLRMTMHQMLFVPFHERMRTPDEKVSAVEVYAYAERNYSFHSPGAVCAGPQFMIEEFLAAIIDGAEPKSGRPRILDPQIEAAAELIEPALDYGLLGLQAFGAIFSIWPAMTRCYHDIHFTLKDWPEPAAPIVSEMGARFERHFEKLTTDTYLANEEWREHREAVYDDMYGQCVFGVTGQWPSESLTARLEPKGSDQALTAKRTLRQAIARRFGGESEITADSLDELTAYIVDFLLRGQAIVRLAEEVQSKTNRLLHRPHPLRLLTLDKINLHNVLMGDDVRTLPFLTEELTALFGIKIHVDANTIEIRENISPERHSGRTSCPNNSVQ
jgi:hypothetical protein